uniref:LysM domain-containing protein n=1 Tax=uncultured Alphaproteobacteria bacterium TaxID=91750 RepID=A0A6G8F2S1_9PROT|nr:hypothetical protein PlAlph_4280 [uncultured Alphaproteobacteria bacterium]
MRILSALLLFFWLAGCAGWWGNTPNEIVVGRGDTLYSLSKRHDIQLRDLIDANNLTPPYTLKVGQVLTVPASNYHIIAKGDTLYSISRQYGVDVTTLAANNGIEPPYTLIVGQRLNIKGKSAAATPHFQPAKSATKHSPSVSTPKTATKPLSARKSATAAKSVKKSASPQKSKTVSKYRKTKFAWPVRGTIVSKYGTIGKGRANDGINIKAAKGTAVKAADKGTIAYAGNELKGFGNLILIKHDDGWITAYAHNDKLLVKKGQKVARGEKIATVGTTGGVSTPQLHFETRAGKNPVNPVSYLQ